MSPYAPGNWPDRAPNRGCLWIALIPAAVALASIAATVARVVS